MNIIETTIIAIKALNLNKVRSALTMLGVIIGVFSVISMISLGRGVENYITDQFNALGSNLIFVSPGKLDIQNDPSTNFTRNKLDEKHIELIETYAKDYIEFATPSVRKGDNLKYKTNSIFSTIIGTNENSNSIINLTLDRGRFFTRAEVGSKAKVVVIGPEVQKELFAGQDPIGKRLKVQNESFEVIGVLEKKNQEYDGNVIAPYTAVKEVYDIERFSSIGVKAKDAESVDVAIRQVELALLRDLDPDDFTVLSQQEVLGSIQDILQILTLSLGAIAGISLVVGGIGIMNIMLVSVTERIREIGLRKAVGANSYNIGMQFLVESVILSVTGGMIGLFFGWLGTIGVNRFIRAEIPLYGVLVAFGFSVFVGIVFGTYPAIQASKKNPIDALRYE